MRDKSENPIPEMIQASQIIPTEKILYAMFNTSLLAFVAFVPDLNVLQGIVDIVVPRLLAFKLRLSTQFGTW